MTRFTLWCGIRTGSTSGSFAEAYELFEEFIKRAYAFMGMASPGRWPLRDFGSIQWADVSAKGFDWFLEQSRAKKDAPLSMLRQLGQVLPRLKHAETQNRMECDLLVAVTLIGQMRHQIVHSRGIVTDKKAFSEGVLKKLGLSGTGAVQHLEFIDQTLLLSPQDGSIYVLKVRSPESTAPIRIHYDVFDGLVRYLLMYAHQTYLALGGLDVDRFDEELTGLHG